MTGVREPGVYRAGRRQETPHGPGYRLVLVLPDGGELPAGWAVESRHGRRTRWVTYGVDGELVVSAAYRDGGVLTYVLLEHADQLKRRPEPAEPVEEPRAAVTAPLLRWERHGDRVTGSFRGIDVVRLFDVNHGISGTQDLVTSNFDLPMPGPYVAGSGTWKGRGALDKGKAWAEEHLRLWLDRMGLELKGSS